MTNPNPTRDPVAQVIQWVLDGASELDIREAINAHFPKEDGEALIVSAMREIERRAATPKALLIGFCIESTRDLYRRMVEIGDFAGALRATKQLLELSKRVGPSPAASAGDDGPNLNLLDVG